MTDFIIAAPEIFINNQKIGIVPLSSSLIPGYGEQNVLVQSLGGDLTTIVISEDVTTAFAKFKFALFASEGNIELAKKWKVDPGNNIIGIVFNQFTRTIASGTITNNYEIMFAKEGKINLEACGLRAV